VSIAGNLGSNGGKIVTAAHKLVILHTSVLVRLQVYVQRLRLHRCTNEPSLQTVGQSLSDLLSGSKSPADKKWAWI